MLWIVGGQQIIRGFAKVWPDRIRSAVSAQFEHVPWVDGDVLSADRCPRLQEMVFPFTVIGMNALAVYMATQVFDFRKVGDIFVGSLLPRVDRWDEVLAYSASLTAIWLTLYWMYRTRTFVKLRAMNLMWMWL